MVPADVYLDAASATPLRPEARDAIVAALDVPGDPLMIHAPGRAARALLDDARSSIAETIGAQPDELVFTSGGTESVALAIWGGVRAQRELGTRIGSALSNTLRRRRLPRLGSDGLAEGRRPGRAGATPISLVPR